MTRVRKTKQAPPVLPKIHRLFALKRRGYDPTGRVRQLLEQRNASADAVDADGNTTLHAACMYGHPGVVPILIHYRADVNARNNAGKTALQLACQYGYTYAVEALLKAGADPDVKDDGGDTLLHLACYRGHAATARVLIKHGADANARNNNGYTPLHLACNGWSHEDSIYQLLLDADADIEAKDNYDDTPLHHACGFGHPDAVKFLLEHGADVNAKDKGGRIPRALVPSAAAKEEIKEEIIDLFWEYDPDVRDAMMETQCTSADECEGGDAMSKERLLFRAFQRSDLEAVCSHVDAGADVNARAAFGDTPLHLVCEYRHPDIARLLLEHGADVNAGNERGDTPLHNACYEGCIDLARLFLEAGADANARNNNGRTPLHLACRFGYASTARLLLEAGADVNAKDNDGETPLQLALKLPTGDVREQIIDLFREHHPDLVMEAWCTSGR